MEMSTILVVDDDPLVLSGIAKNLEVSGYMVATAGNGEEAFSLLNRGAFDLVMTDLMMTPVDGMEVLKKAKELFPDIMVIILTGYGDLYSAIDALRYGADDYLIKPCELNEIRYRISRCLEKLALKRKLKDRTLKLEAVNQELRREIVERKRTEEALKRSEAELRILTSQLLSAEESDNKRMALKIHDDIGQSLIAIKLKAENSLAALRNGSSEAGLDSLKSIVPLAQETVQKVRQLARKIRPSTLDNLGILATVNSFCREFQDAHPQVTIQKELAVDEDAVATYQKTVIFRVLQEAMDNVVKHSGADRVRVGLGKKDDWLEFEMEDNGRGFDIEEIVSSNSGPQRGFGLAVMKKRAEVSGGEFTVTSDVGQGTRVRIAWPCF